MRGSRLFPFMAAGRIAAVRFDEYGVRLTGPEALRPLAETLNTAFLIDPERMLTLLIDGRGQNFDGGLAYAYPGEGVSVLRDCVRCDYYEQGLLVRETDFATAALWMCRAAIEGGATLDAPFTDALGSLRWQRWLHLPRSLGVPFEARIIMDVTDVSSGTRVARILSDGEAGRIHLFDPAWQQTLLDTFCKPVHAEPPAPTVLPPFHQATLDYLADVELHRCGLTGRIAQPPDHSDASARQRHLRLL